jgi:phage minor structural protein
LFPILYKKDETDFTHNGLGIMADTISVMVTEELNGVCELKIKYDASGSLFNIIDYELIIKVKSNDTQEPQLFRIYDYEKDQESDSIAIYAQHITYDLAGNFIESLEVENQSAIYAMEQIEENLAYPTQFNFTSDKENLSSTALKKLNPLQAIAGVEGSLLDVWGGEIERDNFNISLKSRRGNDNGVKISWRKNLTGLNAKFNIEGVITGIYPFKKLEDGTEVYLPEKYVYSSEANKYQYKRIISVDFASDETVTSVDTLRTAAEKYFDTGDKDKAKVSMTVKFEPLWQTEEYKGVANLERVGLGDTVLVDNERLNITATAKVIKIEFNVITEKNESVEIGDVKAKYTSAVNNSINTAVKDAVKEFPTKSFLSNAIDSATSKITGNSGGNILLYPKDHPQELFIMDTEDVNTAVHVWRFNLSGLGYSSNGVNGPFEVAITADGHIVAKFVDTGELNTEILKTATIESSDGTLSISLGDNKIIVTHSDGSKTELSGSGANKVINDASYAYHSMMYVGVAIIPDSQNDIIVQLPDEFKNRQFTAVAQAASLQNLAEGFVLKTYEVIVDSESTDYENASIKIKGTCIATEIANPSNSPKIDFQITYVVTA